MASLYIGLSGYAYKEWQGEGRFYPPDLKQAEYFPYYVSRYNALEADGTWYKMPAETMVEKWKSETPADFKVSPKMHRKVTHRTKLEDDAVDALTFFLKRLKPLEDAGKLGAILIQLPPYLKRNDDLLGQFLSEIPRRETLPWCLEFRSKSWHAPEIEDLLRTYNVAWVAGDTDEEDAQRRDTASHVYARLRKTDYPEDALKNWSEYFADKIVQGKDCYVYCKHEDAETPWLWADRIRELVGEISSASTKP